MNNQELQNELNNLKNNIDKRIPVMNSTEFISKIMHKIFSTVLTEDAICEFIKNAYKAQIAEYKEVDAGVRFQICLQYMYDRPMTWGGEYINNVGEVDITLSGFCNNTVTTYNIPVDAGEFSFMDDENIQVRLEAFEKALMAEFENNNMDQIQVLDCRYDADTKNDYLVYKYFATMIYRMNT